VRGVVLVGSIDLSLHLMLPDKGKGRAVGVLSFIGGGTASHSSNRIFIQHHNM
jgi:hypothetical protein